MNKRAEISAQTKQNLIDAFWDLYTQKSIGKITVKEITLKAGYNRSTFYEYFTDVYDVLEQIEDALLPTKENFALPPMKMVDSLDAFLGFYERNSKYFAVLLGENGDPAFLSKIKTAVKPVFEEELLLIGVTDEFKLNAILEYSLSALLGIFTYWFSLSEKPPLEDFISLIAEIKRDGERAALEKIINS